MATYYVHTGANGNGTLANPWNDINFAAAQLKPGDTLYIRGGTYFGNGHGRPVLIGNSGTASAWITISAYQSEEVIIDGRAGVGGINNGIPKTGTNKVNPKTGAEGYEDGLFDMRGCSYVRLVNIKVMNSMGKGLRVFAGKFWNRWGNPKPPAPQKFIELDNVWVGPSRRHGLLLNNCSDITLKGCTIYKAGDYYPEMRLADAKTDWSGGLACQNVENINVISGTTFNNVYGESLIFDTNSNFSSGLLVDGAFFYNGMVALLSFHGAQNGIIRNSVFCNLSTWDKNTVNAHDEGIYIRASEPGLIAPDGSQIESKNLEIYNNIIFGCKTNIAIAGNAQADWLRNIKIYHNTFVNPMAGNSVIFVNARNTSGIAIKNNIFWNKAGQTVLSVTNPEVNRSHWDVNYNAWSTAPGHAFMVGPNDVVASDLGLVNHTHRPDNVSKISLANFKPKTGAAILNQGIYLSAVPRDFSKTNRGNPPEIGALEQNSAIPVFPPPDDPPPTDPPPGNTPSVTASFTCTPLSGNAPLTVSFNGSASSADNDTIASQTFEFTEPVSGAKQTYTTLTGNAVLSTPGKWTVKLTVRGASGAEDTQTNTAYITVKSEQDPNPGVSGGVVYDVVEITQPTVTGDQAPIAHGLGTLPKAIIVFGTKASANGTPAADSQFIAGYSDTINHRSVTTINEDATSPSDNGHRQSASHLIVTHNEDAGGIESAATLKTVTTTNFTLNWSAVDGVQRKYYALLIGGPGAAATVGTLAAGVKGSTTTVDVGHQVDLLISATNLWPIDGISGAGEISLGMALPNGTQYAASYQNRLAKMPVEANGKIDLTRGSWAAVRERGIVWTLSGSTISGKVEGNDINGDVTYLALTLSEINLNLSILDTPITAGETPYNQLNETPGFVLAFLTNLTQTGTVVNNGDVGVLGAFLSDGTTAGVVEIYSKDAATPTSVEKSYVNNKFVLLNNVGTALVSGAVAFTGTGWKITTDATPDTVARKMVVLAAGKSPATTTPNAEFTWSPVTPKPGETTAFEDLSTNNGLTGTTTWNWTWGDGSAASTTQNPSHSWSAAGTYDVTLTYTVNGVQSVKTRTVTVVDNEVVADFTISSREGVAPHNASMNSAPSQNADTYEWIIVKTSDVKGYAELDTQVLDNRSIWYHTANSASFLYTFAEVGAYSIQLKASKSSTGAYDINLQHSAVLVTGTGPSTNVTASTTTGNAPLVVTFSATDNTNGDEVVDSYYHIEEPDGTEYTFHQDDLQYTFTKTGTNTVTRTLQTKNGTATSSQSITVTGGSSGVIGPSLPETSGARTPNTVIPVSGQSYEKHTHYIEATTEGKRDTILKTDLAGSTRMAALGLGVAPPDTSDLSRGKKRLLIDGWIDFNHAEGSERGIDASQGPLNIRARQGIVLNPGSRFILPDRPNYHSLGSREYQYLSIYAAELNVQNIVARNVISTIGGSILVAPTETLLLQLKESSSDAGPGGYGTIHVSSPFAKKWDYLLLKTWNKIEYIQISGDPVKVSDNHYTYSVVRNKEGDPEGAEYWPEGQAVVNVGGSEWFYSNGTARPSPSVGHGGLIDIYAENPMTEYETGASHTWGPTIVGRIRNSKEYYDTVPAWAIGNLNQMYGYTGDVMGVGLGKYIHGVPSAYITVDVNNGIRFHSNSRVVMSLDDDTGLNFVSDGATSQDRHLSFVDSNKNEHSYIGAVIATYSNQMQIEVKRITGKGSYLYLEADAASGEEAYSSWKLAQNGSEKTAFSQWYDSANARGHVYIKSTAGGGAYFINSYLSIPNIANTPAIDPINGENGHMYIRGGKLIFQYKDGSGVMHYKYINLYDAGTTWSHSTTAP